MKFEVSIGMVVDVPVEIDCADLPSDVPRKTDANGQEYVDIEAALEGGAVDGAINDAIGSAEYLAAYQYLLTALRMARDVNPSCEYTARITPVLGRPEVFEA